ncbi:MAG: UDP-N-acetylglucosamine 2-epimerase (non-hydrolyzing) [Bacteroidetes bacterium]|nr:UDP-N-acetylglucosamine 2-epimerase (non-hydrolyzing) [Bacteroidota bacterium]
MKIVTVVGARPQFVKASVISRCIQTYFSDLITEIIIHTGQHFDANMSDVFFQQMQIPKPDYFLDINSLGHGAMTGQMLEKIEQILIKEKPDWVLVYGDTNSTLAAALAAKKLHIKLAHVEAGLRSYNMAMPEEINRILTDRISDILFCPTDIAVENLQKEGFNNFDTKIVKTGDVMLDATLFYSSFSKNIPELEHENYILATIHRAENTDDEQKLQSIFKAFAEISQRSNCTIVLPLHPRTKKCVENFTITFDTNNIKIIDPVGYLEMIGLLKNCRFVMTDSGGLQKEAFFLKKMCLTIREETEWVELVQNGFNMLTGSNCNNIVHEYEKIQSLNPDFSISLYGDGNAGYVIVNTLLISK